MGAPTWTFDIQTNEPTTQNIYSSARMSAQTLEAIQAKRLAFLKASQRLPAAFSKASDKENGGTINAELPPPASEADVTNVTKLWGDSNKYVAPARDKLSKGERTDPLIREAQTAAKAGDTKGAAILLEQSQKLIHKAAKNFDLEWIPFVDLALTVFDPTVPEDKQESGPFGGVFVSKGEFPFMVLAFKGTTYQLEVGTDANWKTSEPREGVLYGERAHAGMFQGLFDLFPGYDQSAFDIIFENLERVAKDIQSTKQAPVPLYVAGHSLGAGYADLAYIQLTSRLANTPTSYKLLDLYTYGGPRVSLNPLAVKVKEVLGNTGRHLWRITRNNDIVPGFPMLVPVGEEWMSYKHFDIGYRLTPNIPPFVNQRISEIDGSFINDLALSWTWHWPPMYYEGVRKVLDNSNA
ncbi:hypothetical protein HWV62_15509 [Athelia sp. TMB]|nr:hypothetical protein HWV62_20762 [Athelia sp. TMB]KAF7973347.1 hypothetical protein HWV62_15509 [Athelia sp. TMB]